MAQTASRTLGANVGSRPRQYGTARWKNEHPTTGSRRGGLSTDSVSHVRRACIGGRVVDHRSGMTHRRAPPLARPFSHSFAADSPPLFSGAPSEEPDGRSTLDPPEPFPLTRGTGYDARNPQAARETPTRRGVQEPLREQAHRGGHAARCPPGPCRQPRLLHARTAPRQLRHRAPETTSSRHIVTCLGIGIFSSSCRRSMRRCCRQRTFCR